MKNNIFGYIFIIFIVVIMAFAIYRVKIQNGNNNENNTTSSSSVQEVKKGTEMTLAISEFDTINPIITSNKKVQDIDKLIYESLINITEDYKIEYSLAKEIAKNSEKTYIVKLKSGIKWSDGNRFTSDDVKFTIDRLKDENASSVYAQNVKDIEEVDIIDNTTLRIILLKEVQNFEYYLNFPILSNEYYAGSNFWNTEKNIAPVTTGRFKISEVTNNTIVLEKNADWWNKEKKSIIEKITINLYSTVAELYNAFKMGSIDLISTQNPLYQDYIGTIGYDVTEVEGKEFVFLALNTNNSILSDVNIRKAIRASIDKNRVISNSYGNIYKSTNFPLSTLFFSDNEVEENFYSIEEKNNLLSASGWELRKGIWQKDINYRTNSIQLNLIVRAKDTARTKAAEDIKNQLQEQGILINIIYASDSEYNSYLNNKNYDMLLCSIEQPIAPDLNSYFGSKNYANYANSEVKEIMNYIGNLSDENELKAKYRRLYEIYNEEVPYIGIARNKILVIKNTNLIGEVKANWYNLFYKIDEWYTD